MGIKMKYSNKAADTFLFPIDMDIENYVPIHAHAAYADDLDLRIKMRLVADILTAGRVKLQMRRENSSKLKTDNNLSINFYDLRNIAKDKTENLRVTDPHAAQICTTLGDAIVMSKSGSLNELSQALLAASHGRYSLGRYVRDLAVVDREHVATLTICDRPQAVGFNPGAQPVYVSTGFSLEQIGKLQEAGLDGLSQQELGYDETIGGKAIPGICTRTNNVFNLVGSAELCCRIRGDKIVLFDMANEDHRAYDQEFMCEVRRKHKKRHAARTKGLVYSQLALGPV